MAMRKNKNENIPDYVPIWEKLYLTLDEAAAYTGIGINRLREITNAPDCDYVLFVGTKRLICRKRLEAHLEKRSVL